MWILCPKRRKPRCGSFRRTGFLRQWQGRRPRLFGSPAPRILQLTPPSFDTRRPSPMAAYAVVSTATRAPTMLLDCADVAEIQEAPVSGEKNIPPDAVPTMMLVRVRWTCGTVVKQDAFKSARPLLDDAHVSPPSVEMYTPLPGIAANRFPPTEQNACTLPPAGSPKLDAVQFFPPSLVRYAPVVVPANRDV